VHPANDAKKELQGCIAPVSLFDGEGKGLRSRIALDAVQKLLFPPLSEGKPVYLILKSNEHEPA
jgi:hypothetical protein